MILKKIIPAILYLFVMPSALSQETSDLVTGTITVKDSLIDSRIMKFPATVETYDKKQIEESVNAATPAQTLKYLPSIQVRESSKMGHGKSGRNTKDKYDVWAFFFILRRKFNGGCDQYRNTNA